jgi:hypothetical protein
MLRERGWPVDVFNLGSPGSDPIRYADVAERAIPVLGPDVVLVGLLQGDDLMQLPFVEGGSPKAALRLRASNLVRHAFPSLYELVAAWKEKRTGSQPGFWALMNVEFRNAARDVQRSFTTEQAARFVGLAPDVKELFESGGLNPALINLAMRLPGYYMGPVREPAMFLEGRRRNLTTALSRIRAAAEPVKADTLVLGIPSSAYVSADAQQRLARLGFEMDPSALETEVPDRLGSAAAAEAKVAWFSATSAFREEASASDRYFPWDNHFTPAGHRRFAALIVAEVERLLAARTTGKLQPRTSRSTGEPEKRNGNAAPM